MTGAPVNVSNNMVVVSMGQRLHKLG
jgi:hypothetical protein